MYIVGNWKMYKTAIEAKKYIDILVPQIKGSPSQIYLAVPFTALGALSDHGHVRIGAQNMSEALEGAFTGEISAPMLKEAGATFVILGHSERRQLFGETSERVIKKVQTALKEHIQPILCIGETAHERDAGKTEEVLRKQLSGLSELGNLMIAYEPVWAIGSGRSASLEQIEQVHGFCKELLGKKVPILYGGSVKLENIEEIVSLPNVDGVLVGGASLDPDLFARMIQKT